LTPGTDGLTPGAGIVGGGGCPDVVLVPIGWSGPGVVLVPCHGG